MSALKTEDFSLNQKFLILTYIDPTV